MTPEQDAEFNSLLSEFGNDCDKQALNEAVGTSYDADPQGSRAAVVAYVDSLLAEKDAVIAELKAQLEEIRAAHDEAQSVLSVLNADPTVAMFQIATHFQVMGNKVGQILQDGQS
jgi:hypothetical protein